MAPVGYPGRGSLPISSQGVLSCLGWGFTPTSLTDSRSIPAGDHMKPAVLLSRILEKALEGFEKPTKMLLSLGPERLQEFQQLARRVTE